MALGDRVYGVTVIETPTCRFDFVLARQTSNHGNHINLPRHCQRLVLLLLILCYTIFLESCPGKHYRGASVQLLCCIL